jgi:AraC family transcriptional regulator, exoenzyme S synthesis regulatory protein ExsA
MNIPEQKEIRYKGRVVFESLTSPAGITRFPKPFFEDEACFLYVYQGNFQFRTPTKLLHFTEGDAMLARCGNYFVEKTELKPEKETDTITVVGAFFYPDMVKSFFTGELNPGEVEQQIDAKKVNVEPLLKSFADSISFLLSHQEMADENMIATKLKELLLILCRTENAPTIQHLLQRIFSPLDYQFSEIIEAHIFNRLTIKEYAYLCGMSISTFKRKFEQIYHETPARYLMRRKLENARRILLTEKQTVSETAYDCGFENISAFSKAYKVHFGYPPSETLNHIDK